MEKCTSLLIQYNLGYRYDYYYTVTCDFMVIFGHTTWTMFISTVGSKLPEQRIIQRWKFWRCWCNLLHSFLDARHAFMFRSLEANVKDGHWTLTEPHRRKDKREFPFGVQSKVRNKERRDITKTKHKLIKSLERMLYWSLYFKLQELN